MINRSGFSLIELMVAVVVLAIGILGFAGSAIYLSRQATIADLRAERSRVKADVLERLRTLPFDSVRSGSDSIGAFGVAWTVQNFFTAKAVILVVRGPGHAPASSGSLPGITSDLADTVYYRIPLR